MTKIGTLTLLAFLMGLNCFSQIRVSDNQKFLVDKNNKPFFWLGDTDWELFHRMNREQATEFINTRSEQGFNVLQAVALAEFNGIREPNRYGDLPLNNEDPTTLALTPGNDPNDSHQYDYWDHVDFIINLAAEKGMYIGLLPTWGDKVAHLWGDGPIIFNPQNAEVYGRTLAKRYAKQWNIIWILGGDRPAVYRDNLINWDDTPIWRAMAKGIEDVLGKEAFITYHPAGGDNSTSSYIHDEPWLDMNSFQSGHGSRTVEAWDYVVRDLAKKPQKPTLDMEPCYEDHPVNPWDKKWTRERGYFNAYDVRARIYRGVFAGACGVTYGHHQVWQFLDPALYEPINVGDTIIGWQKASRAEGAAEMQYLKNLMLSRPYFSRVVNQTIVAADKGTDYTNLLYATSDKNKSYAMIYLPHNRPVKINLSNVAGTTKNVWWYDVRNGKAIKGEPAKGNGVKLFTPPKHDRDWVLVIDDASKNFPPPGTKADK